MLFAIIWWIVSARKWFKGPKVNIEHQMVGRGGHVIEGKDGAHESGESSANSITKETGIINDTKVGYSA